MNGQMKGYKDLLKNTVPVQISPELRRVKINYHDLLGYARKKGVKVPDLSDSEIDKFIINSSMSQIRKLRHQ